MTDLNSNYRHELNKLWDKSDKLEAQVTELKVQTKHVTAKVEAMNDKMHESNGRLSAALSDLCAESKKLSDAVIRMDAENHTKGGMIDRWAPLAVGFVTLLLVGIQAYHSYSGGVTP